MVPVQKIDPKTGKVTEVRIANARPMNLTAGHDGHVWFTDPVGNQVGKIDPDTGAATVYPVPTARAGLGSITAGPDGTFWFTERGGSGMPGSAGPRAVGKIGKIDPTTGTVTEFPVPTTGTEPYAIAASPNGDLWFTSFTTNTIGKVDAKTGKVTEFPFSSATGYMTAVPGYMTAITTGCDGNIYFVANNAGTIGRVDSTGKVTELLIPTAHAQPFGIAAASDGNVWFTEEIIQRVGRMRVGKTEAGKNVKACAHPPT